jgi:RND family efflux transporter MFP subunit
MTIAEASRVRTKQIVPKWLIVFGVVSIVSMAVYGMARVFVPILQSRGLLPGAPPVVVTAPVEAIDAVRTVEASGALEAAQQVDLFWKTTGTVQAVLVKVGDSVVAGQELMLLDPLTAPQSVLVAKAELINAQTTQDALLHPTKMQIAKAKQALAAALENLRTMERRSNSVAKPNMSYYEKALRDAEFALIKAQQNSEAVDLSTSGSAKNALDAAADNEKKAQERLIAVQKGLGGCGYTPNPAFKRLNTVTVGGRTYSVNTDLSLSLVTDPESLRDPDAKCDPARKVTVDGVAQTEQEALDSYNGARDRTRQAQIAYSQASMTNTMALDKAQEARDDAARYLRIAQEDPNQLDMQVAEANLLEAQARVSDAEETLGELLNGAPQSDLDAADARVLAAQATLNGLAVRAPFAGTILAVNYMPGDTAGAATAAVRLADLSSLHIEVFVDETEVARVKAGQPVEISFDALPEQKAAGKVMEIARFGTTVQGLVRYSTLVRLQDAMQSLALGMTGNVKIETEVLKGALAIPVDSVKFDAEGEYVMLKVAGGAEDKRVAIKTGLLQGDQILVTGDLKVGDTVIVYDAKPTESGSPFGGR